MSHGPSDRSAAGVAAGVVARRARSRHRRSPSDRAHGPSLREDANVAARVRERIDRSCRPTRSHASAGRAAVDAVGARAAPTISARGPRA